MKAVRVDSDDFPVAGPAGTLEAVIDQIPQSQLRFLCIVCHPHPLHEGTMQNKVVMTIARTAARSGGVAARFNYRGVGASQGHYDGGRGELDDALAVSAALRADYGTELPMVVAGFSFGGAIAYRVAAESKAAALITVAPAWERIPSDVAVRHERWLLVQGDDDEVIPAAGVIAWAQAQTPSPEIARIESAGHFFHGRLPQLADAVSAWLDKQGI